MKKKHQGDKMPKKQTTLATSQSSSYYAARVIQRVALLLAAGSTIILWTSLIAIARTTSLYASYVDTTQTSTQTELTAGISHEISTLTNYAATLSVLAIVLSLLLLGLPRVQKYEKRIVVDGAVIATFCFIAAVWCQPIYRAILARVA
jgi:uncharacterized BrkB/YihY/UPF0761 family membrane protein